MITSGVENIYHVLLDGRAKVLGVHKGNNIMYVDLGIRTAYWPDPVRQANTPAGERKIWRHVLSPCGSYYKEIPIEFYGWEQW